MSVWKVLNTNKNIIKSPLPIYLKHQVYNASYDRHTGVNHGN